MDLHQAKAKLDELISAGQGATTAELIAVRGLLESPAQPNSGGGPGEEDPEQ